MSTGRSCSRWLLRSATHSVPHTLCKHVDKIIHLGTWIASYWSLCLLGG
jgi:hypothetical protein